VIDMECKNARQLIPSYLDGELTEAQASPLRKHLLDCQPCRGATQGEKNMKRWFVDAEPVAIPRDFSARVARRAFAGDTGEGYVTAPVGPLVGSSAASEDDGHLRFVLRLTAVAAAVLIFLSLALSRINLPSESRLMADDHPEVSLDRALDELDRLEKDAPLTSTPATSTPVKGAAQQPSKEAAPQSSRKP
jgi:hypothetical protein